MCLRARTPRIVKARIIFFVAAVLVPTESIVAAALPLTNPDFIASRNYSVGQSPGALAIGDFNGDGKPDIATVNLTSNDVSVLMNAGDGTYLASASYAVGTNPVAIAIGDFNGDGKLDVAVLNRISSSISVLLGNGDGTFQLQKSTNITTGDLPDSLAIADFNGDGKLDIAVTVGLAAIGQHAIAVLLGNGDGTFQPATNYDGGSGAQFVNVADFNGDAKPDIVVVDQNQRAISVLLGKGDGTFQTPINTPATTNVGPIALADFNHDGRVDIAMAGGNSSSSFFVFLGDGTGSFRTPVATTGSNLVSSVAASDLNGDGLPDVLVLTDIGFSVFLGVGNGTFVQGDSFVLSPNSGIPVIVDLNGDGKRDLAAVDGSSDRVAVTFGNGDGTFEVAKNIITPSGASEVLAADVNGDGVLDLVALGSNKNQTVSILLGKGDGSFRPSIDTAIALFSAGLKIADLNLDGKLDLLFVTRSIGAFGVLIGNADGTFQPPVYYPGTSIVVGDFTGDGVPDVIATDTQGNLLLFKGIGDGTFGFPQQVLTLSVGTSPMAVGDFNNDGKLDIAVAGAGVAILLGNGDGSFQPGSTSPLAAGPSNMAVGDFNHDGNLDLAVTIPSQTEQPSPSPINTVSVFLGDGTGNLRAAVYYPVGVVPNQVVVGDLNRDGNLDLIVANSTSADVSVLLGLGDGSFQSAENFGGNGFSPSVAFGDFNGDGVPDVAVGASNRGVSILTNRAIGPTPAVALAPNLVAFGKQAVGLTTGPQVVTLSNTGTANLSITGIALAGAQAVDFSQNTSCGITLLAGSYCTITIAFTPSALGTRTATILFADSAFDSPQVISLSGTGVTTTPGAGLAPMRLTFANELITASSSSQPIVVTNTGNAHLAISSISISGTNGGDFSQSGSCPVSPSLLAPQSSCSIDVTFSPTAVGSRSARLSVTDNASGSPQIIPLAGVGTDFSLTAATGNNCPANGNCSVSTVISAGQTATYNLQVSPASGFGDNVALSCTGAPAPSNCTVSSSTVPTGASGSYAFTVTVSNTTAATVLPLSNGLRKPWILLFNPTALGLALTAAFIIARSLAVQQSKLRTISCFAVLTFACFVYLNGCGGGSGVPSQSASHNPTNATLTITGISNGVERTLNLTLTINH